MMIMAADCKEVNFDLRRWSGYVPNTISDLLADVSGMDDVSEKLAKLRHYVSLLEQELTKIHAFKRELPLCMHLLNGAIEKLKEEVMRYDEGERKEMRPVMEEFIPLKGTSDEEERVKMSKDFSDKKDWMSSVQLWTTPVHYENSHIKKQESLPALKSSDEEVDSSSARNKFFGSFDFRKNRGGAFVPFKKQSTADVVIEEEEEQKPALPVHGLSLSIPVAEIDSIDSSLKGDCSAPNYDLSQTRQLRQHEQRKQRRCWSPELHKRFVDALRQLGGAQAATPKQIRDVMRVDGLTNDEVKSHLQKYRLHIRKLPSSAATSSSSWLTREQAGESSKANVSQSDSPQGPFQLHGSAKGVSVTIGDSMEEEDDDKSEGHSWKGQSASEAH